MTVGVIGLGYVGSCIAATVADRGFDVVGVDADHRLIEELTGGVCRFSEHELQDRLFRGLATGRLTVTTDYAALSAADVILIVVGTPVRDDGSLADDQLRAACTTLSRHLRPGQLVLLKSTVPPGTTRGLVLPLLESGGLVGGVDFSLGFTPERLAEGNALDDLDKLPIVVAGLDDAAARAAADFWHRTIGVETIAVESLEAAEITKLADNWWIDLNIALANELAKFCALFDVDVLDVIAAANTIPKGNGNINILLPSVGVGGSCLTKDPWMVRESARQRGLAIETAKVGREVNSGMPDYTARLILDGVAAGGKSPSASKVAVLGLAFKNNTGDLRSTPVQGVIDALIEAGADVTAYDPLVDATKAKEQLDVRPGTTLHEVVQDADCLAVLALHREFEDIDFSALPVAPGCLVLDGRAYYSKAKIAELRGLGYRYRGVGR
jgi:UDP-N-acetyl-D-mannosaminuronic acid dehydrogenase